MRKILSLFRLNKASAFVLVVGAAVMAMSGFAFAVPTAGETAITDGATSVADSLGNIAVAVLPVVATVLAITIGWRLAVKFLRGAK